MIKSMLLALIKIYQKTLSPDHSWVKQYYPYGYCRFYPSCSEYTYQVIVKYGIFKGSLKGIKRIISCNPCSSPKIDLP